MNANELILCVIGVIVLFLIFNRCPQRSSFMFANPNYQYSAPTIGNENDYYKCLVSECRGDTDKYECLEKCHLKSMRKGMSQPDIQDRVCEAYAGHNEEDYFKCLDTIYSDYRYK